MAAVAVLGHVTHVPDGPPGQAAGGVAANAIAVGAVRGHVTHVHSAYLGDRAPPHPAPTTPVCGHVKHAHCACLVSCDRAPLPASPTGPLDKRQVEWLLSLWGQCVAGGSLDKMQNVMKRLPLVQRRQLTDTVCTANPMLITCCWQGCTHMVHYLLDECGADIEKEGKS